MEFEVGDLVTRISYGHDVVFKITAIEDNNIKLKGISVRLYADSNADDLVFCSKEIEEITKDDDSFKDSVRDLINLDRSQYFYLPGRILHIDGDEDYLEKCLKFYREANVLVYGIHEDEEEMSINIKKYLTDINPDILVITGHDAYYKKNGKKDDIKSYKNTDKFIKTVIEARKYEKAYDKLIIIAGACQSNYEALLKSGANFASSPKRVNIHALDPAIIALTLSLTDKSKDIDLIDVLKKTKYGESGIGGIITKGTMYVGYPR
ncbi:MAG: sporulation peptidase YabG [Bacilli bacterium]|jgi:spore coat assembly protein|nr:sporulation peptidase YabG [Bacilli bacterium]